MYVYIRIKFNAQNMQIIKQIMNEIDEIALHGRVPNDQKIFKCALDIKL